MEGQKGDRKTHTHTKIPVMDSEILIFLSEKGSLQSLFHSQFI